MSGPKVVNIQAVRRQQRRESAVRLRELNATLEECLRLQGESAGATAFRENVRALVTRIDGLREAGQWGDLLAETASHCEFYRSEAETLRQAASKTHAEALRREHRLRRAAVQIATALESLPASSARDEAMRKLAAAHDGAVALRGAIAEASDFISNARAETAAAKDATILRELAEAFADPAAVAETRLKPEAERDPDEIRLDRCWTLLGEMELTEPAEATLPWKERTIVLAEAAADQRPLLLDSLVLDLTTYVRSRRADKEARAIVAGAIADLEGVVAAEAEVWRQRLSSALDQSVDSEVLKQLAIEAQSWIAEENAREDAREKRAAVLHAIAALGYEVREGMEAAWIEDGRLVVHKPNERLYGVEFTAAASGAALQTRVVALGGQERTKQRDREVEETWCEELKRLRGLLKSGGFETKLAQAHLAGTVPIKVVGVEGSRSGKDQLRGTPGGLRSKKIG